MTTYGLTGDIITPLIFVLIGIITAYYNKNMLIVLLTSLIFSNIVKYGNKLAINTEGFSEGLTEKNEKNEMDETNPAGNTSGKKNTDEQIDTITNKEVNENSEPIKKFKIMKEEMDNLLQSLEEKVNSVNVELNNLQEKIKKKAKQSGVIIK